MGDTPVSREARFGQRSLLKDFDDYADELESFSKRKDRRKPKSKLSVKELAANKNKISSAAKFDDPDLQHLYERGHLTELVGELKSGKEATVYLARGPQGLLAAKVYSDMAVRSFKNDQVYRQGRYLSSKRIKKAIEQRSRTGMKAQQALWIMHEYTQLWEFYKAGLSVPRPIVGPGVEDIAGAGRVVLMSFVGDEAGAAPRLADVKLELETAENAFAQSLDIMVDLLKLGKVHGDYSTYNLLWWEGRVVAIDFPQVVDIEENPEAWDLLSRDVRSLCKSFKPFGVEAEPGLVELEVKKRARRSPDPLLRAL